MKNEKTEISVAEWAKRQGLSRQAAYRRIESLGIPRSPGGVYKEEADELVSARLDTRKQRGGARQSIQGEELNKARTRRESAKADQARVEADLALQSVVAVEEVLRVWGQLFSPAKTKLMGIGAKVGPMVAVESDTGACKAIIDGAVYAALAEIAEDGAKLGGGGPVKGDAPSCWRKHSPVQSVDAPIFSMYDQIK